ncbi:C-type lectin domain family 2 member B-like isoform X2 [Tiliqua scincoides]|uniref:C-type lectin domain family 2 member B-like isoform X2 n=1 Tax=Tiliqua scincoides TaxID=71010 RepID=UPI003462E639
MAGTEAAERDSPGFELMGQQHPEADGAREPQNAALIPKCIKEKKYTLAAAGVITALVITIIALAARKPESCQPCPPPVDAACPNRWIGYQGKCYYISGDRRNWTESKINCSVFGASLALIDSQLDLDFLIKLTRPHHYWIGLSREEDKAWRWTNGTELNNRLKVRGEGQCAYLNDNGISSTWCFTEKTFLCNQPEAYSRRRK